MRSPSELYEIVDPRPVESPSPALVYSLAGFVDAGHAGALASDHLTNLFDSRVLARFDVDQLVDYRSRRPAMTFSGDHYSHTEEYTLTLEAMTDAQGREFYLLRGPEPDFQWERVVAAVRELVERYGIQRAVAGHGMPWAAPHTRPLRMTAFASRRELIAGSPRWIDEVRVPGNMVGLLQLRLAESGTDTVGFAVQVPHYLADVEYPPAAVALLDAVGEAAAIDIPTDALRAAGVDVLAKVDEQVAAAPQLQEAITGMEKAFDAESGQLGLASGGTVPESELPVGDELADEVEEFLRGMGGQ